jgi:hypothetical protein
LTGNVPKDNIAMNKQHTSCTAFTFSAKNARSETSIDIFFKFLV